MKVPPKRKGNLDLAKTPIGRIALNESPSEKEGKLLRVMWSEHNGMDPQ